MTIFGKHFGTPEIGFKVNPELQAEQTYGFAIVYPVHSGTT
jgi:hypothetical protein